MEAPGTSPEGSFQMAGLVELSLVEMPLVDAPEDMGAIASPGELRRDGLPTQSDDVVNNITRPPALL